jgi:hypothetical protein
MLINLSGTWYQYCEIDPATVANLLDAESMGRFYNASIKGNFDYRTHLGNERRGSQGGRQLFLRRAETKTKGTCLHSSI